MGVFPSKQNKIVSLAQAVSLIRNGDIVAVGGNLSAREPMAIIREIIRQGKKNLHTVGGAHGIDIDLMCAGGVIGLVQHSFIGFEADFGLAPNYRRSVESGVVKVKETDCVAVLMQLRASAFGVPFMPTPPVAGTDILKFNPEFKQMACPFTGEEVSLLPALRPNVAVIHAHLADEEGNVKLYPPYFADPLLVEASDKVIISVEKIIARESMKKIGSTIPHYEVTAIVELPLGAHPTSCYPDYSYDRSYIAHYVKLAQQGPEVFNDQYLEKQVLALKTHQDYLESIGGEKKRNRLCKWDENNECWKELMLRDDISN
jgi:glutaconate CoA-transferase, subunit A